jgi:hypothetical protein
MNPPIIALLPSRKARMICVNFCRIPICEQSAPLFAPEKRAVPLKRVADRTAKLQRLNIARFKLTLCVVANPLGDDCGAIGNPVNHEPHRVRVVIAAIAAALVELARFEQCPAVGAYLRDEKSVRFPEMHVELLIVRGAKRNFHH